MIIHRSVPIGHQDIEIVISDEVEALSEAKNSGRASIAILNQNNIPIELTKYACMSIEDIDEAFLQKVAYRFLGMPMTIAEDDELLIRELGEADFMDLQEEYRDLDVDEEKNLGEEDGIFKDKASYLSYIAYQYAFYDFGIWGIYEKKTSGLVGKIGFSMRKEGLAFGYHIFRQYRNRSYAYRGSKLVLDEMLERGCINERVLLYIRKENIPSIHLARKLQKEYGHILTILER